ncbi:MAG: GNAT family N-acetyltransferase [Kurthia sp.]
MKDAFRLVLSNFEEKIIAFNELVNGHIVQTDDAVVSNTYMNTDTFNIVLSKSNAPHKFSQLTSTLIEKELPFSVWIAEEFMNEEWLRAVQSAGLHEGERNKMMILEERKRRGESRKEQLQIKKVNNKETLEHYAQIFQSLFGGSSEQEALQTYFEAVRIEKMSENVQMFVGYLKEEPIATSLLIEGDESYGIYDVMTKESFRGRGFGSEMFQYIVALTEGSSKPIVLQASEDGKNIYKRLGFIEAGEIIVFE